MEIYRKMKTEILKKKEKKRKGKERDFFYVNLPQILYIYIYKTPKTL